MKRNEDKFIGEITENFSELFVDTFWIRYMKEFSNPNIELIGKVQKELTKKINLKFQKKLQNLNYKNRVERNN